MFYVYGGPWRISSEEGFVVGGGGCKTPLTRISSEGEAYPRATRDIYPRVSHTCGIP